MFEITYVVVIYIIILFKYLNSIELGIVYKMNHLSIYNTHIWKSFSCYENILFRVFEV